jgi:inosine-uridine nucleoside N-ribohydrolase
LLIVDTDPALGIPMADVDDAVAIYTLCRGQHTPVALTTCFGNRSGPKTWRVAVELGDRLGIPVFRGADQPGQADNGAVDALLGHRGDVLAIGPLTNIAAALDRGAQWRRLLVLGGTDRWLPNLRGLYTTELNFALDEAAVNTVLARARRAGVAITLFPMEVCRQVLFTAAEFSLLPGWMEEQCRGWLRLGPLLTGRRAVHPWDVLPAMFVLQPDLFTTELRRVRLDSAPGRRGFITWSRGPLSSEVAAATSVDAARFVQAWRDVVR